MQEKQLHTAFCQRLGNLARSYGKAVNDCYIFNQAGVIIAETFTLPSYYNMELVIIN